MTRKHRSRTNQPHGWAVLPDHILSRALQTFSCKELRSVLLVCKTWGSHGPSLLSTSLSLSFTPSASQVKAFVRLSQLSINLNQDDMTAQVDIWDLWGLPNLKKLEIHQVQSLPPLYPAARASSQLQALAIENRFIADSDPLPILPLNLQLLAALRDLDLRYCSGLDSALRSIVRMPALQKLSVQGCGRLDRSLAAVPGGFGGLENLGELTLEDNSTLSMLPSSICALRGLRSLSVCLWCQLRGLPEEVGQLTRLRVLRIEYCTKLVQLPESIGRLRQLERVDLTGCGSLTGLPESIGDLGQLRELNLSFCNSLRCLPDTVGLLTELVELNLQNCEGVKSLPGSLAHLGKLRVLNRQQSFSGMLGKSFMEGSVMLGNRLEG